MLKGVVVDTTTTTSLKTNQTSTTVTADYNLVGGVIKRASINVCSVKGITTPTASKGLSQTTTSSESRVEGIWETDLYLVYEQKIKYEKCTYGSRLIREGR